MSILKAEDRQFRLNTDATILFQAEPSNPLPGVPVARITKGTSLLSPDVVLLDSSYLADTDNAELLERVKAYVAAHIRTVLAPLFALVEENPVDAEGKLLPTLTATARQIGEQLFEGLGIIPRAQVDELIASLDTDARKLMRSAHIRLGPLLVYLPALNKPVSVRLRAVLWTLWHGKSLPAPVPNDGAVSVAVTAEDADPSFYQSIGYPLYGGRAIRIDMLDRVVTEIYDTADKGRFTAQHKMAEWLGCSIPGLYAVIESMGHRRLEEPTVEAAEATEAPVEAATETVAETPAEPTTEAPVEAPVEAAPAEQKRPVLATFILRKGKAHLPQAARSQNFKKDQPKKDFSKKSFSKGSDKAAGDKREDRKDNKKQGGSFADARRKKGGKPDFKKERDDNPRTFRAEAKEQDNPFAILQQLKAKD